MSYLDTIKFQYYPNDVRSVVPLGFITLRELIRAIIEPKEDVKKIFIDIKKASAIGDLKLKNDLKKKLFYFTPCIISDGLGRGYVNIVSFNNIIQVDFDNILNAVQFRDYFFESEPSCILCGVSPSGMGIKALVMIEDVNSVDEYKEYFYGLAESFEKYKGFDQSTQNSCLPLFMFHDPGLRWRDNAVPSKKRGFKVNAFDVNKMIDISNYKGEEAITNEGKLKISEYLNYKINSITGNAYPQILSLGVTIGGLISYYDLDFEAITDYVNTLIDNNDYMQKSLRVYKKGFRDCATQGLQSPWSLKDSICKN